ncbi:voltage-dependent calcium channel subunit alpha-2/delta-3 [Cricetulus griseus]|nr:voltage-dependent calcium channel subunit alpha-2/delta-3 [Cricetulus griseus]
MSSEVRIFTYLIGREAAFADNLKWMACANKGFFTQISTLADVQENVMEYLHVLSRPKVIDQEHDVVWTEAYIDSTGKGFYRDVLVGGRSPGTWFRISFASAASLALYSGLRRDDNASRKSSHALLYQLSDQRGCVRSSAKFEFSMNFRQHGCFHYAVV